MDMDIDFEDSGVNHLVDTGYHDLYDHSEDFEDASAKLRMVNAPEDHALALEVGKQPVLFTSQGFKLTRPVINDQGISTMNISMDNTDLSVSNYMQAAVTSGEPTVVRYRIYLKSDPTAPQNDPPLDLVLSEMKTTLFAVSASATFADIVNMRFLTEKYTRERFPGLGN